MNHTAKVALIAASLGFVGLAMRDAAAGNYQEPAAEYFSLELTPNDYLSHSDSEATVLIDDLTYSCSYAPCSSTTACAFFQQADLPAWSTGGPTTPTGGSGSATLGMPMLNLGSAYTTGGSHNGGGSHSRQASVTTGRKAMHEVILRDSSTGNNGIVFDRFSFNTFGQMAWMSETTSAWFSDWIYSMFWDPGGGGVGIGVGGAGGVGVGQGTGLAMAMYSVPSSGSRHYQSPHIVQNGRVYFQTSYGGTDITGTVNVKGRVISSPATPPTVSSGVTVTWP